jgi:phosphoribosylformylglycinamidine synthase
MVGIIPDKRKRMSLDFKNAGDAIFLIGTSRNDINSSEYLYSYCNVKNSPAPFIDLDEELAVQNVVKSLIEENLIESAHDVSDGGLFITLLESAMPKNLGFKIECDEDLRKDAFLFGESQSRIVVSVNEEKLDVFVALLAEMDVDFMNCGEVTNGEIVIDENNYGSSSDYSMKYNNAISDLMNEDH